MSMKAGCLVAAGIRRLPPSWLSHQLITNCSWLDCPSSLVAGRSSLVVGTDINATPIEESFCAVTIQRPGEPLIVQDAKADPRFATLRTVTGQPFVRFYAGISIIDRNGYALDALCIADRTPREAYFDPTELLIRARQIERLIR